MFFVIRCGGRDNGEDAILHMTAHVLEHKIPARRDGIERVVGEVDVLSSSVSQLVSQ
jgi:hypothetical protein